MFYLLVTLSVYVSRAFSISHDRELRQPQRQPRSQGLSSLPPLVVGTGALVAAGHMTTQNLGG